MEHAFFFPQIDYSVHPAFRNLDVPRHNDNNTTETLIDEIDGELQQLHSTRYADEAALASAFENGPVKAIRALGSHLAATAPTERVERLMKLAIDDVPSELFDEARILNAKHKIKKPARLSDGGARVSSDLDRDGVSIGRLDAKSHRLLLNLCATSMARLREQAKGNPTRRIVETFARYSSVGSVLERYFRRSGILEGLANHFGSNVNFSGFALEYSHPAQEWWHGGYADCGLPDSKTAYMHYDHGCKNPKAIIALSTVSEKNGPTGFLKGSHKKPRSNFVHFLIKSIDIKFIDVVGDLGKGFYRQRFNEVEHRREFIMLPRALQACSHFGDDILDDTPLSNELLAAETKLTEKVGNVVVFDGDYGVHRGALVEEGERFVFQVIFTIEPPIPVRNRIYLQTRALARRVLKGTR